MTTSPRFSQLVFLVILKTIWAVGMVSYYGIGLSPDEAQYWTWSQNLDWGYYSKPPGIAWEIWAGCQLFGNTELGVRFGAILISALLAFAIYALARCCRLKSSTAFWAGVVMSFCPIGIMASFAATTDGGSILFFTLAAAVVASALDRGEGPRFLMVGFFILCGALFKWTTYFFWIWAVLFISYYPRPRMRHVMDGLILSLLALLPSIVWNGRHDWPTFKHVYYTIFKAVGPVAKHVSQSNFFDFLGAQIGLLSPVYFILLCCGIGGLARYRKSASPALVFCGAIFLSIIPYFIASCFNKIQANWAVWVYPTAIVVLCWWALEYRARARVWMHVGAYSSVILSLLVIAVPYIQSHSLFPANPIPYKLNAFRQSLGWQNLKPALQESGYDSTKDFLFGDSYQMASILSFYGEGQNRAYFLNLHSSRKNQFSYWPGLAKEGLNRTGYFVYTENTSDFLAAQDKKVAYYQQVLKPYFHTVIFVRAAPLFSAYGQTVKGALIFKCEGYNGTSPPDPDIY